MMNFSRYNIVKMQKEARSLPAKIRSLVFVFLLRVFVILLAMCVIIGSYSAFGGYLGIISKSPDIEGVFESNKDFEKYSTFLFYSNGEKMEKELSSAGANRIKADIRTIPEGVRNCFVAMEDERFYEHSGIDVRGIFRAAYSVFKERSLDYGASTITQQLLKNLVFKGGKESSPIDKIIRKVQEQGGDIILFTGDLVNMESKEALPFKRQLKRLTAPYGVYSILGNHDYAVYRNFEEKEAQLADIEQLVSLEKECGWHVLRNENTMIEKNGGAHLILLQFLRSE